MHDLTLVGFTTDRRGLIFRTAASAPGDTFVVPVTEQLVAVVAELAAEATDLPKEPSGPVGPVDDAPRPAAEPVRRRSLLSVRDIQARLRAGEPVAQVAREADAEEAWIERFAPPIRAEQRRIVERALAAHQQRPRGRPSASPLRRAVGLAMADRGIAFTTAAFEAAWTARLLGQDRWAVDFTYRHRGPREARWIYDAATGELTAGDRTASQLGHVADDPRASGGGDAVDGIVGDPNASSPITTDAETPSRRTGRRTSRPSAGAAKTAAAGPKTGKATKKARSATKKARSATKKARSATKKARSATKKARSATKKARSGPKVPAGRSTTKAAATKAAATKAAATKAAAGGPKTTAGSGKASAKKAPPTGTAPTGTATKRSATKRAATKRAATKRAATKRAATKPEVTKRTVEPAATEGAPADDGRAPAPATIVRTRTEVPPPSANGGAHLAPRADAAPGPDPTVAPTRPANGANGPVPSRRTVTAPIVPTPSRTQPRPPADGRPVAARPGAVDLDAVPLAPTPPAGAARPPAPERVPVAPEVVDTTDRGRPGARPEGVDRTGARRARAAERSAATVQFRSGSAVPVRASADRTAGPAARRRRQLRGR